MFELFFGLFWEAITSLISFAFLIPVFSGDDTISIFLIGFFLLFHVIGIGLIIIGARKIIRDRSTSKLGEECYGYVIDISPNGNYINGSPQLNAKTVVYIRSENDVREIAEYSGTGTSKYNVGDYVKVKYYNNDINFIEKVPENTIPYDIKDKIYRETSPNISPAATERPQGPIVYYESEDIVQVDGVRYKRIDS